MDARIEIRRDRNNGFEIAVCAPRAQVALPLLTEPHSDYHGAVYAALALRWSTGWAVHDLVSSEGRAGMA